MSHIGSSSSLMSYDNSHLDLQQSNGNSTTYRMLQLIHDDDGQSRIVDSGCNSSMAVQNSNCAVSGSSSKNLSQSAGGQFFVMMSPNEANQSSNQQQRQLVPRPPNCMVTTSGGAGGGREDRRKATHKEVERRRRDKINAWIETLAKLIPDCSDDIKLNESKCAVLSKACDYITSLSDANESLAANESDIVATSEHLAEIRRQFSILQEENRLLWAELNQRGINAPTSLIHPAIELDE